MKTILYFCLYHFLGQEYRKEKTYNYLNVESSNNSVESELNACERVQQKAAIAISRFCKEPKYTSQLIELGGEC